MMEYKCKKCGDDCEVDFDHEEGTADCWCDKCDDYPRGWYDAESYIIIDYFSARGDWLADKAKDEAMGV